MKKKTNNVVFNDLAEAEIQALSHDKGEKKLKTTKVVSLFNNTELNTLLQALDAWKYNSESYLSDMGIDNEGRGSILKNLSKIEKLENKIENILENYD